MERRFLGLGLSGEAGCWSLRGDDRTSKGKEPGSNGTYGGKRAGAAEEKGTVELNSVFEGEGRKRV